MMKSMSVPSILRAGLLICSISTALAQELVDAGCYSSSEPLKDQGLYTFQSSGYCKDLCVKLSKPVMALSKGSNCYCGDYIPVASSKVSDSRCITKCNGYPLESCGGLGYFGVKLTGLDPAVGNYKPESSSTSTTTASSTSLPSPTSDGTSSTPTPSVIVQASTSIILVTAPVKTSTSQSATPDPGSKAANTAGIAAGVIVGLVAIVAIAGGIYFFLRNRKRRALEAEFHRNNANAFLENAKAPDARLDPSVMMQKRQSDGSIADNRDYSRRILKVTNPDGT